MDRLDRETIFAAIQKMQCLVKLEYEECVKQSESPFTTPFTSLGYPLCPHLQLRRN